MNDIYLFHNTVLTGIVMFAIGVLGITTGSSRRSRLFPAMILFGGVAVVWVAGGTFHGQWTGSIGGIVAIVGGAVIALLPAGQTAHQNSTESGPS